MLTKEQKITKSKVVTTIIASLVILFTWTYLLGSFSDDKSSSKKIESKKTETEILQPLDPSIVHTLDYETKLEDNQLTIMGNTNIPDNSVLGVSVSRFVEYGNLEDKRVVDLTEDHVQVNNGKFSYNTTLDDHKWYTDDFLRENKVLETPLKFIYDDIYIIVTFTPASDQPEEIYQLLGRKFENLNPADGSKTSLQITKEIKAPITPEILEIFQEKLAKEETEQKAWEQSKAGKICKDNPEWDKSDCERLANNKIWVGMSLDMLKYKRGLPNVANPSNYGNGNEWQWCWWDYTPSCFYGGDDGIIESYN